MKILKVTWQNRYDYEAIMKCEHCNDESFDKCGYADHNYYINVIPAMNCPHCGKNSDGSLETIRNGITGNPLVKRNNQPTEENGR